MIGFQHLSLTLVRRSNAEHRQTRAECLQTHAEHRQTHAMLRRLARL